MFHGHVLTQSLSSIDIFTFALQLEYLEADFYYWAVKVCRLSDRAIDLAIQFPSWVDEDCFQIQRLDGTKAGFCNGFTVRMWSVRGSGLSDYRSTCRPTAACCCVLDPAQRRQVRTARSGQ